MNVPLIAAGLLALTATAIHGIAGELLVVRRLVPELLPATRFGGPLMTNAMIHVTWHIATVGFLTVGCALILAGTVVDGDAAQALSLLAAGAATGFAGVAVGLGAAAQGGLAQAAASFGRHPGPLVLAVIPVLAWWGAL
jgi:hypothetical protein